MPTGRPPPRLRWPRSSPGGGGRRGRARTSPRPGRASAGRASPPGRSTKAASTNARSRTDETVASAARTGPPGPATSPAPRSSAAITGPRHGRVGLAVTGDGRRDTPAILRPTRPAATGGSLRLDAPRRPLRRPTTRAAARRWPSRCWPSLALVAVGCGVVSTRPRHHRRRRISAGSRRRWSRPGSRSTIRCRATRAARIGSSTPTAISFEASGLDQATPVKIYTYLFADRATFERLRTTVDSCARTYVTDPDTYESAEQSPYVVAGQGPWGPQFKAKLREVLAVTAGTATPAVRAPAGRRRPRARRRAGRGSGAR